MRWACAIRAIGFRCYRRSSLVVRKTRSQMHVISPSRALGGTNGEVQKVWGHVQVCNRSVGTPRGSRRCRVACEPARNDGADFVDAGCGRRCRAARRPATNSPGSMKPAQPFGASPLIVLAAERQRRASGLPKRSASTGLTRHGELRLSSVQGARVHRSICAHVIIRPLDPYKRICRNPAGRSYLGHLLQKSENGGAQNRRETRRGEKVPFNSIVTRLRKPLVAWPVVWVVPHMFFRGALVRPWESWTHRARRLLQQYQPRGDIHRQGRRAVFCCPRQSAWLGFRGRGSWSASCARSKAWS